MEMGRGVENYFLWAKAQSRRKQENNRLLDWPAANSERFRMWRLGGWD